MFKLKISGWVLAATMIVLSSYKGVVPITEDTVIELGSKREIFVDKFLIQELKGAELVMKSPRDEGAVMAFNEPWETNAPAYITILKDTDRYRAYYRGGTPGKNGRSIDNTCYAESQDGIAWEKPILNMVSVNGSKENNVILEEMPLTHNFSPFIDTNPSASASQKYKAFGGTDSSGLIPFVSEDGVHWTKLSQTPVITDGLLDSQNVSFWSESEQVYVCYFRSWTGGGELGYRSVSRSTSKDFLHWTKPVEMSYGDTPFEHIYTQQTSPYFRAPHIYIAIGSRFVPHRQIATLDQLERLQVDPGQHKGLSEPFLMSSRGGTTYDRTFMEAYIRPAVGLNHWSARTNYPSLNVVPTGDSEMSLYVNQDYAQPTGHLRRYSMRLDGFSALNAPYEGGAMITKPFTFEGKELEINYATSAVGEIRIAIQDEHGEEIPGFSMIECAELVGNETVRTVTWNGEKDLSQLSSKPVRLHIYLKDADLYSIRFK
ncbi:hypothetical protein CLV98_1047 [Dyadobacter jejuensis]|uniref:Glycosyl hydrolase family 32 N-terminal domain-containing protein n=1 Tax=Dyadobacter jejuensis TaxID=1082580 RepID=A0A316AMY9_9BACT|nr:hypothetical protein [Dyadobacter jejuensis]PWJ58150.1 hypothetical protein CLV98_1047 [Dyadobacter jejuensis]